MIPVKLSVADSESSTQFQLDNVLESVSWETSLFEQPGKMTVTIVDEGKQQLFSEGSNVVLVVNDEKVFDGYVFSRKRSDKDSMTFTCYDRLRYLQNKDVLMFQNQTAEEIFTTICKNQELPYKVTNGSTYKTAPILHDNKTLYAMIKRALDEAFVATGKYLIIRDKVGELEMVDIESLTTDLLIGDSSLLTGFDFESSIDQETYNYVKLTQEDTTKQVRNVYVAKDSNTIYKWGRLQYYEKVDAEMNESQIKARADQLLKLYNRKTRTLKVECLGDTRISAGSGIAISIAKLEQEGLSKAQYTFVSQATHKISGGEYTLSLSLEVV